MKHVLLNLPVLPRLAFDSSEISALQASSQVVDYSVEHFIECFEQYEKGVIRSASDKYIDALMTQYIEQQEEDISALGQCESTCLDKGHLTDGGEAKESCNETFMDSLKSVIVLLQKDIEKLKDSLKTWRALTAHPKQRKFVIWHVKMLDERQDLLEELKIWSSNSS